MINSVILVGRLVKDPEIRYTQSGQAVGNFTLAVDKQLSKEKKQEMESKNQPTADFPRITVWGKQAENCANYLTKGRLVGVQGSIQTGNYTDADGKTIYTTDILANTVKFLEFGDKKENQNNQSNDYRNIDGFSPSDNQDDIPF